MRRLGSHYRELRAKYPDEELVIVFDIDGTIIDTRHLVREVLLGYDRNHGTEHFRLLEPSDIDVHEGAVRPLLERWPLDEHERESVFEYYESQMWSPQATLAAHQPYRGVMEVIRWFQLQTNTTVALNTGRPEDLRTPTLQALATLGSEYRVRFSNELLLMNPMPQGVGVRDGKVGAIRELEGRGMRVVAVVDNEPDNLEAMAEADHTGEILFLHASTIFLSAVRPVPRSVTGVDYNIDGLITAGDIVGHVQLVNSGIATTRDLARAIDEPVAWLGSTLKADAYGRIELDTAGSATAVSDSLSIDSVLTQVRHVDRSVRLDLTSPDLVDQVLAATARTDTSGERLWVSGPLELLGEYGVRALRKAHPEATISCPVDFLAPLAFAAIEQALETLDLLRAWGVNRVSIRWTQPRVRRLLGVLQAWGQEVDIYDLPDRTSSLEAAVLLPRSVTSDWLLAEEHSNDRGAPVPG